MVIFLLFSLVFPYFLMFNCTTNHSFEDSCYCTTLHNIQDFISQFGRMFYLFRQQHHSSLCYTSLGLHISVYKVLIFHDTTLQHHSSQWYTLLGLYISVYMVLIFHTLQHYRSWCNIQLGLHLSVLKVLIFHNNTLRHHSSLLLGHITVFKVLSVHTTSQLSML